METLKFIFGVGLLIGIGMGIFYLLDLRGKSDPNLQPYIEEKETLSCEARENALLYYDEQVAQNALNLLLQSFLESREFDKSADSEAFERFDPNREKAFELAFEAAKLGDATAQYNVSSFYAYGVGTPLDYGKSVYWARQSAEQDSIGGQIMLATLYANGIGVERDLVEAYKWARLAAREAPVREQRWYFSQLEYDFWRKFFEFLGEVDQEFTGEKIVGSIIEEDLQKAEELAEKIKPYLSNEGLIEANKRINQWLCK